MQALILTLALTLLICQLTFAVAPKKLVAGQHPLTRENMEKFGFGSSEPSNITFTAADITFGVNQLTDGIPLLNGTESFQELTNITDQGIVALQARAEAWFAFWFGIVFPPGPVPKLSVDGVFGIVATAVGSPYAGWSIFDSKKVLNPIDPNKASDYTAVVVIEFVVTPLDQFVGSNFTWGGVYCNLSLPSECAIRFRDTVAYGLYNLTQIQKDSGVPAVGCKNSCPIRNTTATVITNFRSFQVARVQQIFAGYGLTSEETQHCSPTWGAGQGTLQIMFPLNSTYFWFFNNVHYPPPKFAALPPWKNCNGIF